MEFLKKNLKATVAVAVVVVLGLVLFIWYSVHQSVISAGNEKESGLSASYADGANYLSNCVTKTAQSARVATEQSDRVKEIYAAAVAGRYDNGSGTAVDNGKLFSAIAEAYPNLDQVSRTFQDVLAVINGCRDDYRNKQSVVQDRVRDFNTWRTSSWKVRTFGGGNFPNDNLYVDLPNQERLTGQRALSKIAKPIVENSTVDTYRTGVENVPDPFATPTPTK